MPWEGADTGSCGNVVMGGCAVVVGVGVVDMRGSDAAAEYDPGYEDVAVRGIVDTSRSVARRAAKGSLLSFGFAFAFAALFGDDQKDGRLGRYAVHDEEEGFVLEEVVFVVAEPVSVGYVGRGAAAVAAASVAARAWCSHTSRAL